MAVIYLLNKGPCSLSRHFEWAEALHSWARSQQRSVPSAPLVSPQGPAASQGFALKF